MYEKYNILAVILFGSCARDGMTSQSDIDIALLGTITLSTDIICEIEDTLHLYLGKPVDVINLADKYVNLRVKISALNEGLIIKNDDINLFYRHLETLEKDITNNKDFREHLSYVLYEED